MARKSRSDWGRTAEKLGEMLKTFGNTVSEILEDPEVRDKAKDFAQSVVDATAKVIDGKVEDEQVKAKFRSVGKAAQNLGNSVEEHLKA